MTHKKGEIDKSRICGILVITAVIIVIGIFVIVKNSDSIVMSIHDLNGNVNMVWTGMDNNGDEYRVLGILDGEDVKVAYLNKSSFGWWSAPIILDQVPAETGMIALAWTEVAGLRSYVTDMADSPEFEHEYHMLYCGNNAVSLIPSLAEYLPSNVSVCINQAQSFYTIHFISFGTENPMEEIDLYEILKTLGCI